MPSQPAPAPIPARTPAAGKQSSYLKSPLLWTVLVLALALLYPLLSYLAPSSTANGIVRHAPAPPSEAAPVAAIPTPAGSASGEAADPLPAASQPPLRKFTAADLSHYKGIATPANPHALIYIAILSRVYDVTSGVRFYGPGGAYNTFGGRDATVGLARNRVLKGVGEEVETPGGGEEGWRRVLTGGEWESVGRWEGSLSKKYNVVGVLV